MTTATHPPEIRAGGSAVRAIRTAQGLTLRQLATLSDTSVTDLGRFERGEWKPSDLDGWLRSVVDALAENLTVKRTEARA